MFDLTQTLTPDIPRFPGDPEVRIAPLEGIAPWHVSALTLGTHSGTHIDAARHLLGDGPGIGAYGPDRLIGGGLVIDARGFQENTPIPVSVLDYVAGNAWPGWFAILHTGWDRHWRDPRYFRHPYLSEDLAQRLIDLGAGLVAIDALSVDSTVDTGAAAHRLLLGSNILIAENLCRLDLLPTWERLTFAFLPLALGDADGSPARVVAWQTGTFGERQDLSPERPFP